MDQPLPMLGRTHGNRIAVTCHLKCDSACAYPAPNKSTEPTFADIASRQLSRRALLVATGTLAAAAGLPIVLAGCTTSQQNNLPDRRESPAVPSAGLVFDPIDPAPDKVDALIVPEGLPLDTDPALGRSTLRQVAALRSHDAERPRAGAAVRIQQRLSGDHCHRPPRQVSAALLQSRVHQSRDHVPPVQVRCGGALSPQGDDGGARLQRRGAGTLSHAAALAPWCASKPADYGAYAVQDDWSCCGQPAAQDR